MYKKCCHNTFSLIPDNGRKSNIDIYFTNYLRTLRRYIIIIQIQIDFSSLNVNFYIMYGYNKINLRVIWIQSIFLYWNHFLRIKSKLKWKTKRLEVQYEKFIAQVFLYIKIIMYKIIKKNLKFLVIWVKHNYFHTSTTRYYKLICIMHICIKQRQ